MPSAFAHRKFSEVVFERLSPSAKEKLAANERFYLIGAHGPDILFYYKPLTRNSVRALGHAMHQRAARPFFQAAKRKISDSAEPDAALAYTAGFITHFVLDSSCHGYVSEKIKESGVSHTKIEAEFDRALLVKDGKDPLHAKLAEHFCSQKRYASIIAPFFELTTAQTQRTLASVKWYSNLLLAPNDAKRTAIDAVLRAAGKYDDLHEVVMSKVPDPACADSSQKLEKLMMESVPAACSLIEAYIENLDNDEPIDDRFDRNYD